MKLVVGLGNPGREYEQSRHNIGFVVVERLAQQLGAAPWKKQGQALVAKGEVQGQSVLLAQPQTFMNLSGQAVSALMQYYKLTLNDLLVIVDDLELAPGRLRARDKGSHGGHNGLRDIQNHLGTTEYKRIRVGIGRPQSQQNNIVAHVLGKILPAEAQALESALDEASRLAMEFISTGRFSNWSSP